jgi:hypothetical protein
VPAEHRTTGRSIVWPVPCARNLQLCPCKFLNRANQICGFNTSFMLSQNWKWCCGYLSLCGSWTCTSLDIRFARRDTHLLTTVGNIRWGWGEKVYQEVPQIRDTILRYLTDNRAIMCSNHESMWKTHFGCAHRTQEVISNSGMLNVKL